MATFFANLLRSLLPKGRSNSLIWCYIYFKHEPVSFKNIIYFFQGVMSSDASESKITKPSILEPPNCVKGMKLLNKELFNKKVRVPYVEIQEEHVKGATKVLKPYFLKMLHKRPVHGEKNKTILLDPEKLASVELLKEHERNQLENIGITKDCFRWKEECLKYENWTANAILKAVLPGDVSVSSYSIVGHILHLNLRKEHEEYKNIIGQILLDKTPGIRTVVNKKNTIDSTFRNFEMEILAGENDTIVQVKEQGHIYKFDFALVYWNPRLQEEHSRVVSKLTAGCVMYDVFAGVGPFVIPAAKLKCRVLANDLNPHSVEWLEINLKLNKVESFVKTFNQDGRSFITSTIKADLLDMINKKQDQNSSKVHVVMNLPASAVQFLDAFVGLLSDLDSSEIQDKIPIIYIHAYCFVPKDSMYELPVKLVEEILNVCIDEKEVFFVRDVAPNKFMMRISFRLPEVVIFRNVDNAAGEPEAKKRRLSSDSE